VVEADTVLQFTVITTGVVEVVVLCIDEITEVELKPDERLVDEPKEDELVVKLPGGVGEVVLERRLERTLEVTVEELIDDMLGEVLGGMLSELLNEMLDEVLEGRPEELLNCNWRGARR